ncbi:hypothetical protein AALP_AA4G154700 [Arabis alpina]|uniref:DC1 domain-containing protein n=1 Tax=Arabis alpina TaxID=50452 RepID=A0A087H3G9_ARAAL|nr:hypothetical protein AALP_AA4G154700 [Arabis alpina]
MSNGQTINHFSHNHPLSEVNGVGTFTCDGCKLHGNGKTYRCSDCDYDLHEYCATCPQSLRSSYHAPDHELSLIKGPTHMTSCYVCRFYMQGMFYKCKHCSFESHPLCTHGPMHASSPDATVTQQRSLHDPVGQPSPPHHYGQGIPYAYPPMNPYGPYPHGGHHHHPPQHHQPQPQHQHQQQYVNPGSPKADTSGGSSKEGKKKKKGVFGSLLAVAAVTGQAAATLLLATAAESMNAE